jgi:hypothetical protein
MTDIVRAKSEAATVFDLPVEDPTPPLVSEKEGTGDVGWASPEIVLLDHLRRRSEGDLDGDIEVNYHPEVRFLAPMGMLRGHDGVRVAAHRLSRELPDATVSHERVECHGEVCFVQWTADAIAGRIPTAADMLVIRDGQIVAQTSFYVVEPPA